MRSAWMSAAVLSLLSALLPDAWAFQIREPEPHPRPQPVTQSIELQEEHVTMTIKENVSTKTVRMTFHNPSAMQVEEDFLMPVTSDETVSHFRVTIDGKEQIAELLDGTKARTIYDDIVRRRKDPALLEHYSDRLLRVRVFPIGPNSTFEVRVELTQPLKVENNLVRVQTLDLPPTAFLSGAKKVSVTASIESSRPLRTIFSPTHEIQIARTDDSHVSVTYAKENYVPQGPMIFYYSIDPSPLSVNPFSFKETDDEGTFMLTLSPPLTPQEALPRDIIFAIDTSGSMKDGNRLEFVKEALKKFVSTLGPADRFNLVTFSTEANRYKDTLQPVTARSIEAAQRYIDGLLPRGGTNIEEALKLSHDHAFRGEAAKIIVFLTDGLPTIGERDTTKLVQLSKGNQPVRVFCLGVGQDVDTRLLDQMAIENHGDRIYVHPKDDLKVVLDSFAARLHPPVLGNLEVGFDGGVREVYPKILQDVFRGQELVLFGTFPREGDYALTLKADVGGQRKTFTYTVRLGHNKDFTFVPRLWAIQKIDYLLDQIRRNGTQKELIDHVIELSKKYGIVTPYTSFLITEDTPLPIVGMQRRVEEKMKESRDDNFTGRREMDKAGNQMTWRGSYSQEKQLEASNEGAGLGKDLASLQRTMSRMRQVANRTFFNNGNGWIDGRFNADTDGNEIVEVKFLSDEYFELLKKHEDMAKVLSLGDNVTFQHEKKWYSVKK